MESYVREIDVKVNRWEGGEVFPGDMRYPKKYITSCKIMTPSTLSITSYLIIFLLLLTTIDARRSGIATGIAMGLFNGGGEVFLWIIGLFVCLIICLFICGMFLRFINACCGDGVEEVQRRGTGNRKYTDAEETSRV